MGPATPSSPVAHTGSGRGRPDPPDPRPQISQPV